MRKWRRKFYNEVMALSREMLRENGGDYDLPLHRRLMSQIDRIMSRYYANHPDDLNGRIVTEVIEPDARFIAPLAGRRLLGTI